MIVVGYQLRPALAYAVSKAIEECERRQEIAFLFRPITSDYEARQHFGTANLVVFDLSTTKPSDVFNTVRLGLEAHPFVKVAIVPVTLSTHDEQRFLFEFGRLGVSYFADADEALSPNWWVETVSGMTGFNVVLQARRAVFPLVSPGPRGDLIIRISEHAEGCASVKDLAALIYRSEFLSPVTRRKRLWQACKEVELDSPEAVLLAVRLVILKHLLDNSHWTLSRIARHMGHPSGRHLNQTIKRRTGVSLKHLKAVPAVCVKEAAQRVLVRGESIDALGTLANAAKYYTFA
jgi:hypothetical protein